MIGQSRMVACTRVSQIKPHKASATSAENAASLIGQRVFEVLGAR
jgi:hypothetical protein